MLDASTIDKIKDGFRKNRENNPLLSHPERRIPELQVVIEILRYIRSVMFPGFHSNEISHYRPLSKNFYATLNQINCALTEQIVLAYRSQNSSDYSEDEAVNAASEISEKFMEKLPELQAMLLLDVEAIYLGDPAANSRAEILISYPSMQAIFIYRVANALWQARVPLIPRMMGEYAHRITGIEIHPGAQIGESFFIDHGTGVVIGETTVIGKHVKIYQGVTLGAKSLSDGRKLASVKRHPTIEDYVTLYANCTVLGGDTVVGSHSVIGGGAFITKSIPPCTSVMVQASELSMRSNGNNCPEENCEHSVQWDACDEKCEHACVLGAQEN
ncbi:MAG: serine acetyltransferase [Eubacteriales bacterium]|nr:serine acetyltransferase [Eubacteriales bacterium]MDD4323330.1 serine acetyltransferase [Eubacteriales bacterium]MDD4540643.1 serine acetyltransferase [Eubacteriales bacterium]